MQLRALEQLYKKKIVICTLYTVDATEFVTAQIDATFHDGRGNGERYVDDHVNFIGINARMSGA